VNTQTLRNGVSSVINLQPAETLKVVAVTGNYTLTGRAGSVAGTTIATAATGGTYGPYAAPVTLLLASSAQSEIDFDSGTAPVIESDTVARLQTDPLTGVVNALVSGNSVLPLSKIRKLALIGDSRMNAYDYWTPSVASITGSVITLTAATGNNSAQGLGTLQVGETILCALNTGVDYIRATVATSDGTTGLTANINYPTQYPTGSIVNASSRVYHIPSRQQGENSALSWLLALRGEPIDRVVSCAFIGATLQQMITYQADDAINQDCDAAVILGSVNDYLTTGGNKSSAYCIQKIAELWSKLSNRITYHLLESPLGSTYATVTNKTRAAEVNAWILANAQNYGVIVLDQYTPMVDAGTGNFKTGYSNDGLHPSLAAGLNAGIYLSAQNIPFIPRSQWIASTTGQATALQPALNPTMAGTVGAGNLATSYSTAVSGLVTISSQALVALANGNNEQQFVLTATGAGSMQLNCGSMTVVAGGKYRMRGKVRIENGTGLQGIDAKLFNTTGAVLIKFAKAQSNVVASGGASGSYTLTVDQIITIPSGVTNAYMNFRPWFDVAGGATVGFTDIEFIPAP
jgi:hypothetical protein